MVLEKAGLTPAKLESTDLQQKVMALIPHIPDAMLQVVYHQLVPMVDEYVQEQVMTAWSETLAGAETSDRLARESNGRAAATADVA